MVLFLTLKTFSLTGGIEKACRSMIKALDELQITFNVWSMYDDAKALDPRYTSSSNFFGFSGQRLVFAVNCVKAAFKYEKVILSHVNLLLFGKIIKLIRPSAKIILWAHGIEVWRPLPAWKIKFLIEKAEVWAVSEYTKTQLTTLHQIPVERIKVLNNTLDPFLPLAVTFSKPSFILDRHLLKAENFVIFTLTRLSSTEHLKNYDLVIEAVEKLKNQYPQLRYIIGGKADDTEKQRLEQLIEQKQLNESVKLLGFIDEKEIAAYYQSADCFVLPSKKEGFGLVLIEAAANGCQVIGGNIDGSTDALLNGKLGQLVDPDAVDAIAAAIEHAIANKTHDPKLQQQLTIAHFGFQTYKQKVAQLLTATT
jgi:glycosyltransferase involved in cell wall biosynthesis